MKAKKVHFWVKNDSIFKPKKRNFLSKSLYGCSNVPCITLQSLKVLFSTRPALIFVLNNRDGPSFFASPSIPLSFLFIRPVQLSLARPSAGPSAHPSTLPFLCVKNVWTRIMQCCCAVAPLKPVLNENEVVSRRKECLGPGSSSCMKVKTNVSMWSRLGSTFRRIVKEWEEERST